jgi:RHS repeat-associated protein
MTSGNDPQHITPGDLGGHCEAKGMAVPKVHLMDVNLNLTDNPLGYQPPVGPAARFVLRYNQLDIFQPANFNYGNLGSLWTSDWFTYITDDPANPLADVNLYVAGGGQRTYTDFDTNTQSFDYQQYDHNLLTRTSTEPISYQLVYGDGSKMVFSQSDGSTGSSRNIFLTQEIDPAGNALTFSYDSNLCLVAVQDAIGQTTKLTYGLPGTNFGTGLGEIVAASDPYKLTSITDPFGRIATINYAPLPLWLSASYDLNTGKVIQRNNIYAWGLASNTDVIGITSQFGCTPVPTSTTTYITNNLESVIVTYAYIVSSLTTPYGSTSFYSTNNGNIRSVDIAYPDGSRERVEYNQTVTDVPATDPTASVPTGMLTDNTGLLDFRNTYYWDRTACALAYGDYTKARLYHFLHTENGALTSAALESYKSPLEGRIWIDYAGQSSSIIISSNVLPTHVGRVLDDGTTQLYTFAHNQFGHVTSRIDPVGRTFSFTYDTNGIDLLEARQTRLGSDLLAKLKYNSQHRPLTSTDAAGQTTTFSWNARGQLLSITDAKNETTTYNYSANGYLLSINGPLPGTNDTVRISYDQVGRVQTLADISGYTVTCAYDNLDRITRLTYPDNTFTLFSYDRLDCSAFQDRAGRQTTFTHDSLRQLTSATDPLGRVTLFEWCRCGALKSLKDPLGRGTSWTMDVQGRPIVKQYADGSQVSYSYEETTSRLQQVVDEKQQTTFYSYNIDDTLAMMSYGNAALATPSVSFTYDSIYRRLVSMTDGTGTTTYSYIPITPPVLGAGRLGIVDGSLTNSTSTYSYDELGRVVQTSVDGSLSRWALDAGGRLISASNALGTFTYAYDGASSRLVSAGYPNGQTAVASYGSSLQDFTLQQLTYAVGANPVSQFTYGYDIAQMQITNWSQQAGGQAPSVFTLAYDAVDQLLSAVVTNSGNLANSFGYTYDFAGNRLTETIAGSTATATYNPLNQSGTTSDPAAVARTNQWDAQNRLVAIALGNQTTALGYDGASRLVSIDELQNGAQVSSRRFVWSEGRICEERDSTGTVITKRYFPQGFQLETGANAGAYFYTRDHLGSVREVTDSNGNVRARYNYDPYGRRTKVSGDMDADFGFAGMFWSPEASLSLTHYRAYDANLGRWLSRDPFPNAEAREGPNLYAYVGNEPIRKNDPTGLAGTLPQFGLDTVTATLVTMEVTDPDALPQFAEDLGLAANRASQLAAPIAQKCSDAWETLDTTILPGDTPELTDIAVRAAELANKFSTSVTPADFEILTQANIQTDELYDIETEFYELASDLANEEGISLQDAWSRLVDLTKFDPNSWPQLTRVINMSNFDPKDLNPELYPP